MIELSVLAQELKEVIEGVPPQYMLIIVPGFIVALATVAIVIATLIEQQIPNNGQNNH